MLNEKKEVGATENYLKVEENLFIMRCMVDNLRLIATSDELEEVVGSALFGIMLTMEKQLEQIETTI